MEKFQDKFRSDIDKPDKASEQTFPSDISLNIKVYRAPDRANKSVVTYSE